MRINERLNLVFPLYHGDEDLYAWVHSMPISREVFEAHYRLLAKTFTAIHAEGLGEIAGPKIAMLMLKDIAKDINPSDPISLTQPLLNEMRRLSNVLLKTDNGWEALPLQEALNGKHLDQDDLWEVEKILNFFTVVLHMYPRNLRQSFLDGACRMWAAQMSSLNYTEFLNSLPTLTATVSTGEKATTLSVPS